MRAVRVADGADRVLEGPRRRPLEHGVFRLASDGNALYFTIGAALYHSYPDSAPVQLTGSTSGGGATKFSQYGSLVLPTPDSRGAAFIVAPDTVRLYNAETRTSRPLARGCTALHAFSPDGRQVLCSGNLIVSTVDGSVQSFAGPLGRELYLVKAVNWTDRGIQFMLSVAFGVTELIDVASGTTSTVLSREQASALGYPYDGQFTWSRDGRKVGFSTVRLCWACKYGGQSAVLVYDMDTKRTVTAAVINADIGDLAFSPDGRRIAYLAVQSLQIYVAAVP